MSRALAWFNRVMLLTVGMGVSGAIALMWHLDNWGLTPERAAKRDGYCQDATLMKAQRQTRTQYLVVCQGLPNSSDGGHVIVSQMPWGVWWASPSGGNFSYQESDFSSSSDLVDYIHYGPTHSVETSLILLGRVRSAEIVALEATLSNNQILRDQVTNGLFVFDAPIRAIGVQVNELRVIGRDNQILQRIVVSPMGV